MDGAGVGVTVLLPQSEKSCLTIKARKRVLATACVEKARVLKAAVAAARTTRVRDRRIGRYIGALRGG
jgi:hypothetical protein